MLQRFCQGREVQTLTWCKKNLHDKTSFFWWKIKISHKQHVEVSADQPGDSSMPGIHLFCEGHTGIFSLWTGWCFGSEGPSLPSSKYTSWETEQVLGREGCRPLHAWGGVRCSCASREISLNRIPRRTPFLAAQAGWLCLRVQGGMSAIPFKALQVESLH